MAKIHAAILCQNGDFIRDVYGKERLAQIAELVDLRPGIFKEEDLGKVDFSEVEILFSSWSFPALSEAQWAEYFPRLKAVFYAAGATDTFARPLFARNVRVVSAWRANSIPVAEFTVAQIILGLKNYFQLARTGHSRENFRSRYRGCGAFGATVTLLGSTGAIATRVAKMLESYSLKVIGIPSPVAERTITFEEAFKVSQVVSNHLPNRDDNVGCITGAMLASMPYGGVFINTGRGRQVNEPEMIEVLKQRPDLTALLDVQFPEPPVEGSPLYTLPNVFLTPHIAGSLGDELHRMADYMIDELKHYLKGEALQYEVCESMLLTSK